MPLITAYNLRTSDPLGDIAKAVTVALTSRAHLKINDHEVDFIPMLAPPNAPSDVARINVELWIRPQLTKAELQILSTDIGNAFKKETDASRKVKVVIYPYDPEIRGWVSM